MIGSAAVRHTTGRPSPSVGPLPRLDAEREQLTRLLRGLSARLDQLDRDLADLAWRRHRLGRWSGPADLLHEKTTLEAEHGRLTARLSVLARQLNELDSKLTDDTGQQHHPSPRVGICPECGYPSLGSGLCAFCRPHLVR